MRFTYLPTETKLSTWQARHQTRKGAHAVVLARLIEGISLSPTSAGCCPEQSSSSYQRGQVVSPFRLKASTSFGLGVTDYSGSVWVKGNEVENSAFIVELPTVGDET